MTRKDRQDNTTINDWGYDRKLGILKLKQRITSEDPYYRNQRKRIFEFTFDSQYLLKKLIINKFGEDNVEYYPNEKADCTDDYFFEYYEIIKPKIYISIDTDLDLKPYWGVIFLKMEENDKDIFDFMEFEREIDSVLRDFPWELDEGFRSIIRPSPWFYKDWFKSDKFMVVCFGSLWCYCMCALYYLINDISIWLYSYLVFMIMYFGIILIRELNLVPLTYKKPLKNRLFYSGLGFSIIPLLVIIGVELYKTSSLFLDLELILASVTFIVIFGIIPFYIGIKAVILERAERLDFLSSMPRSYKNAIDPQNPDIYTI
jgi:hypothetical protein